VVCFLDRVGRHPDLEECVGLAVTAFAVPVLQGRIPPGVHFPEEAFNTETSRGVYDVATRGCFAWETPSSGAHSEEAAVGAR
jgi:hypothetical protein